ncbi:TerB family tellurite resistance protein [Sediminibacterium roseum]|uniref:TerB family tellurite resistance protein n=1 Tax=Sediminibacterium roseum TaxID=1978412 RepID=A0ABW9ZVW0_9BACT|nr:TerB family tellurite resistance protein [Sediminibacterium roseum]NCI51302.1 TerB family tellurite resistance protein [Sediminibacterium roseum]
MKRKVVLYVLLVLVFFRSSAQVRELEQLALNIQKLAQLKAMYQSMVNGYHTLLKGYDLVINVSKGNFDLHKNHLDGLMAVNAPVKNYGKIEYISATQELLIKDNRAGYLRCVASKAFSLTELSARQSEGFKLLNESVKHLDELLLVVTPGKLRMSDAERIAAIDRIGDSMANLLAEARKLNAANDALMVLRGQRQKDVKEMKTLNGIKN